jgi:hypothetical protein
MCIRDVSMRRQRGFPVVRLATIGIHRLRIRTAQVIATIPDAGQFFCQL